MSKRNLEKLFDEYVENMHIRNLSQNTIDHRLRCGRKFLNWCSDRDISSPKQLDRKTIDAYQRYIYRMRRRDGKPLSVRSQLLHLDVVRGLCRYLLRTEQLIRDPTLDMELPKKPKSLPKSVISIDEMRRVMSMPDLNRASGLRDRAILEVLWATGIRRKELLELDIYSIDAVQKTVMVHGKGDKDRVVPIGEKAVQWVVRYLDEGRPQLTDDPDEQALFVTTRGSRINRESLSQYVSGYIRKAGLGKQGSCHLIRHSVGTMLMQNGMNLRQLQEILGHAKLETTEIYTHITINELKNAYNRTHPSAK